MAHGHKKRILVIDDEEPIRRLLSQVLEKCGFEVLTASDGEVGVAMAYTEQPDLILVDLVMPGMSGTEAIAQIKAEPVTKGVPIVVLTAESTRENVLSAKAVGANQIVAKMDFELGGFLKKILGLLGEAHPKESTVPEPMAQAAKRIGLDPAAEPEASPSVPSSFPAPAQRKPEAPGQAGSHR